MDTPRTNDLYRMLAKDYKPKEAEMQICKYMQTLEAEIDALTARVQALESNKAETVTTTAQEIKTATAKKRKEA